MYFCAFCFSSVTQWCWSVTSPSFTAPPSVPWPQLHNSTIPVSPSPLVLLQPHASHPRLPSGSSQDLSPVVSQVSSSGKEQCGGKRKGCPGRWKEGRAVSEAVDHCRVMLCYHCVSSLDEKHSPSKCPLRYLVRLEQCNYWTFCSEASKVGAYLMKLSLYCYSELHFN